jgi:hypothetical protein
MNQPKQTRQRHDLREKRQEIHGKRRKLHERLSEVCEDFVFENTSLEHRQKAIVGELQYLADYYRDDANWRDVI